MMIHSTRSISLVLCKKDYKMPIHRTVLLIKEILEESNKPLTTAEMAARIGVDPQTIRNHLKSALSEGYVVLTNIKDGKAYTYTVAGKKTTNYVSIQWGDESREIRDLFTTWGTKRLPPNRNAAQIAKLVCKLYEYADAFIADKDNTDMAYQTKLTMMKELKQRTLLHLKHHREMVATLNSLVELDIWEPKTLVKELFIKDEEISAEQIHNILSLLEITQKPANP